MYGVLFLCGPQRSVGHRLSELNVPTLMQLETLDPSVISVRINLQYTSHLINKHRKNKRSLIITTKIRRFITIFLRGTKPRDFSFCLLHMQNYNIEIMKNSYLFLFCFL